MGSLRRVGYGRGARVPEHPMLIGRACGALTLAAAPCATMENAFHTISCMRVRGKVVQVDVGGLAVVNLGALAARPPETCPRA